MVRSEKLPSNDASTTLDGAINDSTTSITVTDGSVFPSEGDYRVIVGAELMVVTARSSNTLTVVRGAEGSTADSHTTGSSIAMIITKGGLEKYITDWVDPWAFQRPPNRILDGSGNVLTASDFTQNNMGTGTLSDAADGSIVLNAQARTPPNIAGMTRSAPSTPYTVTAHMVAGPLEADANDGEIVMGFRESGTSKLQYLTFMYGIQYEVKSLADFNDATGAPADTGLIAGPHRGDYWFRLGYDGSDLTYDVSPDGVTWYEVHTEADNTWFTTAPDQIFWGGTNETWTGNLCPITLMAWLED